MPCPHFSKLQQLQPPRLSQSVHREECTQCFDDQVNCIFKTTLIDAYTNLKDSPNGIEICLSCFNGGCIDQARRHAVVHVQKSGHRFTLNVKRRAKASQSKRVWSTTYFPSMILTDSLGRRRGASCKIEEACDCRRTRRGQIRLYHGREMLGMRFAACVWDTGCNIWSQSKSTLFKMVSTI